MVYDDRAVTFAGRLLVYKGYEEVADLTVESSLWTHQWTPSVPKIKIGIPRFTD